MSYAEIRESVYHMIYSGQFASASTIISDASSNSDTKLVLRSLVNSYQGYHSQVIHDARQISDISELDHLCQFDQKYSLIRSLWYQDQIDEALKLMDEFLNQLSEMSIPDKSLKYIRAYLYLLKSYILLNIERALFRVGTDWNTDDVDLPVSYASKSITLFNEINDPIGIQLSNIALAFGNRIRKDIQEQFSLLNEAYNYFNMRDLRFLEAYTLNLQAMLLHIEYIDFDTIKEYYLKSLDLCQNMGYLSGEATVNFNLGWYYIDLSDLEKGFQYFDQSRKFYSELNDKNNAAWVDYHHGFAYIFPGDSQKAIDLFTSTCIPVFEKLGNNKALITAYSRLGSAYSNTGQLDRGIEYWQKSIELASSFHYDVVGSFYSKMNLSIVGSLQGEYTTPEQVNTYMYQNMGNWGYEYYRAQVAWSLGDIEKKKGNFDGALEFYKKSIQMNKHREQVMIVCFQDIICNYSIVLIGSEIYPDMDIAPYVHDREFYNFDVPDWLLLCLNCTKAIYLLTSPRLKDKYKAQEILQNILSSGQWLYYALGFTPEFLYLETLLTEYQVSGEIVVLEEINKVVSRVDKLAREMKSKPVLIEINMIQSRLNQINGDFDKAREILQNLIFTTEESNLFELSSKIKDELRNLEETFNTYSQWISQNVSMKDRVEKLKIADYIAKAKQKMLKS